MLAVSMNLSDEIEPHYWISHPDEVYIPVKRSERSDPASSEPESPSKVVEFEEYGTGRQLRCRVDSIVGTIAPPASITLSSINEDLVENDDISEPSILWSLKSRFHEDKIYSAIGTIIIAVNPYKDIISLYSGEHLAQYIASSAPITPHIWRVTKEAYQKLSHLKIR